MAEKLELTTSQQNIAKLLAGSLNIDNFLNQLFQDPANHTAMCASLQEYHRNDGGSPEVHAFEIIRVAFNPDSLTGRFTCKFRVQYHYTCSDVRNDAGDTIVWDFKLDKENGMLYLTGEEPLVRDGDE